MKGTATVVITIMIDVETALTRDNNLGNIIDDLNNDARNKISKKLGVEKSDVYVRSTRIVIDGTENIVTGV